MTDRAFLCISHTLRSAGDRSILVWDFSLFVDAPYGCRPLLFDVPDDSLTAAGDMDMLHSHGLIASCPHPLNRKLSFGMVLAIAFLLLVSLVISASLAAFGKLWGDLEGGWGIVSQAANLIVSFVVVTGLFALMYKLLPRTRIAWRDVWVGAAVTTLLFTIGKYLIGLYLGRASIESAFGAAGSLVVLVIWVYYSAQIFLLGAEFTWVYAHNHGSRIGQEKSASRIAHRE